jgi:alpha-tubulin suppressor-like RCC1 family protein
VKDVASGGDHTCVIKPDSTVACWGLDADGQLGQGVHFIAGPVGVRMTCP